jgi:anthranilate phosphoribosyltransferase
MIDSILGTASGDPALHEKIAQVVARLGTKKTMVVHSEDGLDEVSLGAPTRVFEIEGNTLRSLTIAPEDAAGGCLDAFSSGH